MKPVSVHIRYSDQNRQLDEVATLSQEGHLIYNDGGGDFKAHLNTSIKFAALTVASPLISLARLVRSAVFVFLGEFNRSGREFIGALAAPILTSGCLAGSLLSSFFYVISSGSASFYVAMRRTYAAFESWINQIDLRSGDLPSYSHRVSGALDCGSRIWTTAPCMQPMLEKGFSAEGGLLDRARIQKLFPYVKVNDVLMEGDQVVIQSEYDQVDTHYIACNGACEHRKVSTDFCCCYRVETVYDRILCCEVGQGTCTSMSNSGDSCGIVSCGCGQVGVCCCYTKENHNWTALNTGCFGPGGLFYVTGVQRVRA